MFTEIKRLSLRLISITIVTCLVVSSSFLLPANSNWFAHDYSNWLAVQDAAASTVTTKTIAAGTPYATTLYIIKGEQPGPVLMVTGGVHGNEIAGYKAANLIKKYKISRGTLLVLPEANKIAVHNGTRTCKGVGDLNRSFPNSSTGSPDDVLAQAIWKVVKDYKVTWLVDLHEGYNYHKVYNPSVGQSLIYYPRTGSYSVGKAVISRLNQDIDNPDHRFSLFPTPLPKTLARSTSEFLGVHGFTFETCNLQPLSTRINQHQLAIKTFLIQLGMI